MYGYPLCITRIGSGCAACGGRERRAVPFGCARRWPRRPGLADGARRAHQILAYYALRYRAHAAARVCMCIIACNKVIDKRKRKQALLTEWLYILSRTRSFDLQGIFDQRIIRTFLQACKCYDTWYNYNWTFFRWTKKDASGNESLLDELDLMKACDTTKTIDINRQLFLQTLWPFHNYEHKNCVLCIILNQTFAQKISTSCFAFNLRSFHH